MRNISFFTWWHKTLITALRNQGQCDHQLKNDLYGIVRLVLKKEKQNFNVAIVSWFSTSCLTSHGQGHEHTHSLVLCFRSFVRLSYIYVISPFDFFFNLIWYQVQWYYFAWELSVLWKSFKSISHFSIYFSFLPKISLVPIVGYVCSLCSEFH